MSFRSSFLEPKTWLLVNVPLMGEMDLHTFWGEADLRFCAYCVPPHAAPSSSSSSSNNNNTGANGLPKLHPQSTNQYLFSIEVKHQSNHRALSKANEFAAADTVDPCANGALVTDAMNVAEGSNGGTPAHCSLSQTPFNPPSQPTLLTHPLHLPSQPNLSTHPSLNPPLQPPY